jgi:Spy/CpxP family protein refolding chaperone
MKYLVCILCCSATVAFAQPSWHRDGGGERMMRDNDPMAKLDLTQEQRHQIRKMRSDMQKNQIALRAKIQTATKIQTARIEMRDLFQEEKPDQSRIDSKISDISRLQNEVKLAHIAMWFNVNKLLTPEQQKIWKERPMMNERMQMKGRFHGPMMKRDMMGEKSGESDEMDVDESEDAGG